MKKNIRLKSFKSALTILASLACLCMSHYSLSQPAPHHPKKNHVQVILIPDGQGGYKAEGIANPKNRHVDLRGAPGSHKVTFTLWEKTNAGLISIENKDFDLMVTFQQPLHGNPLLCASPKPWRDKHPDKPLKKGKRVIKLNKLKHNDNDCYNYILQVDVNNDGVADIDIDPWLRIKH